MAVADIVIKQEAIQAVDLESKILTLCQENAKGVTDGIIQQSMPSIPAQQRVMAINRLLSTVSHSHLTPTLLIKKSTLLILCHLEDK